MRGTTVRRCGGDAGVVQVTSVSPGSKVRVLSEGAGKRVMQRTVFLELGFPGKYYPLHQPRLLF